MLDQLGERGLPAQLAAAQYVAVRAVFDRVDDELAFQGFLDARRIKRHCDLLNGIEHQRLAAPAFAQVVAAIAHQVGRSGAACQKADVQTRSGDLVQQHMHQGEQKGWIGLWFDGDPFG